MYKVDLSVHEIVDFLLRSGDIDDRYFNNFTMQEGSKIHSEYQNKQQDNYLNEVKLETTIYYDVFEYHISGRADGIILDPERTIIDEIKSTNDNLEIFFEKNKKWHLGQTQFYAYMYAKQNKLERIWVRLTYIHQISKKIILREFEYSIFELEKIILDFIKDYSSFRAVILRRDNSFLESLQQMEFPFSHLRNGQDILVNETRNAAINREFIFIEAATGLGKTISTLYGALQAIKEKKVNRIFYLAAKNSGFESALDAIKIYKKNGLKVSAVQISAKTKMCINDKKIGRCNPAECPYTKGYYSKLQDTIKEIITSNDIFDKDYIIDLGKRNYMCPFELSLDISLYCDVIICDYNYVFNPISLLKRYFENRDKEYLKFLLIDEAHNLINRSRDMYSQTLPYELYLEAREDFMMLESKKIKKAIKALDEDFDLFFKCEFDDYLVLEKMDDNFIEHLDFLNKVCSEYKNEIGFKSSKIDEFLLEAYKFQNIYSYFQNNEDIYKLYLEKDTNGRFSVNIKCLDASRFIKNTLHKTFGSVFFSGTLSPLDYYKKLICDNTNLNSYHIDSPFNKNNLKLLLSNKVSLRYKDRNSTINEVAQQCRAFVEQKEGNYFIFCPSFEYLEKLEKLLENINGKLVVQKRNMSDDEKTVFLTNFKVVSKQTKVGLVVLGGSFCESIDLSGDQLIGVVVIGIGLSAVSFETNIYKEYFEKIGLNGFDYAYFNPGLNKVMQAVGRLIRTENDTGIALLIDNRFSNKRYNDLFKLTWSNFKVVDNAIDVKREVIAFYNQNK